MCYFISMPNINWNQITNNVFNNFNRVAQNNVQNTQQAPLEQSSQQQNAQQTLQQFLPQTANQLSKTVAELAMLNKQQTADMLKELLQMPKNFEQFLKQLTVNSQNLQQNTALLMLASTLNLSQLASLLQTNSKEAMTNLYQMLAQYNQLGLSMKEEQLLEFTKLISVVAASSTSDIQSLKTLMLMYLPWLPLTDPNAFKLEYMENGGMEASEVVDSTTILIATENYGNLQADIYKTKEDGIKIEVTTSQTFPIEELVVLMREESKKHNVNISINHLAKEAFNKEKNEEEQIKVCVNISSKVNPFLLLISNAVIKNVHTIDGKESLREERKERMSDGES